MDRSIFVLTLFCGFYIGAQSLQCYVCYDCSTVKDDDLKTCESLISSTGDLTILSTSTTKTSSGSSTEPSSTLLGSTTAEPSILTSSTKAAPTNSSYTRTTLESITIPPSSTLTEPKTGSPTTAMMTETTTIQGSLNLTTISAIPNNTESSTPAISPIELTTTSTTTTMTASNTTEKPKISTISIELTNRTSEPTTTISTTEPVITFTTITTVTEPTSNATKESLSSATTTQVSAGEHNVTEDSFDDLRRSDRSLLGDCVCKSDKVCECPLTHERPKRFITKVKIQDLLVHDDDTFACVVDKIRVNGTRIIRRGCAFLENDQKTLCEEAGFGSRCRSCGTDKCNGAAASTTKQYFLLLTAFVSFIQYYTYK